MSRIEKGRDYQYILFDLDGTLTDSSEGITRCVQYALDAFGIHVEDRSTLLRFIGPPLKNSLMEFYGMNEETAARAADKYRERYNTIGMFENRVYDGIYELLDMLRANGYRTAVATSKPENATRRILEHFHLSERFDAVAGAAPDGSGGGKPDLIRTALKLLGAEEAAWQRQAIMIGDRKFDMEGASVVGIDSVGVLYGFSPEGELEQYHATYLAASPDDIQKIFE